MKFSLSVNRSAKYPGPGSIPSTTKIPYSPDGEKADYEIYLLAADSMGPRLISHDEYFSSHEVPPSVYALVCTDRSVGGKRVKAVHFLSRVFGLSDIVTDSDGDLVFTVLADMMALPGQGGYYDPYPMPYYWNAKVLSDEALTAEILFRPAYDVMRWIREATDMYNTSWSFNDLASEVTFKMTSADGSLTSTTVCPCSSYAGSSISLDEYLWADGLVLRSLSLQGAAESHSIRSARLFSLVAAVKPEEGDYALYWTCALSANKLVDMVFASAQSMPNTVESLSGAVKMVLLGPWPMNQ